MNELERAVEALDATISNAQRVRAELLLVPGNDGDPTTDKWVSWIRLIHLITVNANVAGLRLMEASCRQSEAQAQFAEAQACQAVAGKGAQ